MYFHCYEDLSKIVPYMFKQKENTSVAREIWSECICKVKLHTSEKSFEETNLILKKIWGETSSLFNTRWPYKKKKKKKKKKVEKITFNGVVNRKCEEFNLKELTHDMFECLLFV